jgi:hypothetical protein
MDRTFKTTDSQEAALEYFALKAGQTKDVLYAEGVGNWLDKCVSQITSEKVNEVKTKYEKAPVELQAAVDLALKDVVIAEPVPIVKEEVILEK